VSLPRAELDYVAAPRRARAAGYALLAFSIACAGVLLERYRTAKLESAGIESARALLPGERRAAPSARGAGEDLRQAEAVVRQLALPWAAMIHAVEDAASAEVAVMQMEPDARERRLRLSAEAKDETAMLEYLRRLGRADALTDVQLASHQIVLEDARRPVQFSVLARLR
jgi:hypothetical protein